MVWCGVAPRAPLARFLEMHMYVTSALQKTDMKSVFLQMAMDLLHEKVLVTIKVYFI